MGKLLFYKMLCCLFLIYSNLFSTNNINQEKESTIEQKLFIKINALIEKERKINQTSVAYYNEAGFISENKTEKINECIQNLEKKINATKGIIAGDNFIKVKQLLEVAQQKKNELQYDFAQEIIMYANSNFFSSPIATVEISPGIFSPDGDKHNDVLYMYPKLYNVPISKPIKHWEMNIYQVIGDRGNSITNIIIKSFQKKGAIQTIFNWQGGLENDNTIDSDCLFYLIFSATDNDGNTVYSQKKYFKTDIYVKKTARGYVIDIPDVFFDANKYLLTEQYKYLIQRIYEKLKDYPDYFIAIEGHSETIINIEYSLQLTKNRAQAIAGYLAQLGIWSERIRTYGLGEFLPRTLDKSQEYLNRRVSFVLLRDRKAIQRYEKNISKILEFKKDE